MNNSLQKYQSKIQPTISVLLQPCNENQELNYIENYKGTPDTIIQHCLEIIAGLQKTLRLGTFSVKIESQNFTDCIYVDLENLYDKNFERISSISPNTIYHYLK
ncbi:MAG: hypothetical protein M3R14_07310 [Acidobacteriota bacterium]|nr:hypothetical protein [Acidobacteriota bacterium]